MMPAAWPRHASLLSRPEFLGPGGNLLLRLNRVGQFLPRITATSARSCWACLLKLLGFFVKELLCLLGSRRWPPVAAGARHWAKRLTLVPQFIGSIVHLPGRIGHRLYNFRRGPRGQPAPASWRRRAIKAADCRSANSVKSLACVFTLAIGLYLLFLFE